VAALADAIFGMGTTLSFGHAVTLAGTSDNRTGLDFGDRHLATAPNAPVLSAGSDTGASNSDRVTNRKRVRFAER
jgi:hypothetical protein